MHAVQHGEVTCQMDSCIVKINRLIGKVLVQMMMYLKVCFMLILCIRSCSTFSQGRWIAGHNLQGPEKISVGFHRCIFGVKGNVRARFSSKGGEVARARDCLLRNGGQRNG